MRRYLLLCANEHLEFRIPELKSIAEVYDIPCKWVDTPTTEPYVTVDLPSESHVTQLVSRSVLVKSCYELYGKATTEDELHQQIKSYPKEYILPYCRADQTFRVRIETFCNKLTTKEKLEKIETFSFLPVKGEVRLDNPDVSFHLFEFYGVDPNNIPKKPYTLHFGRWIADGHRSLIHAISLKKRKFIGNTSMDPQLSLLMCNQALVKNGDLILDPFCGTGSLMVAAAKFGGYVLGADIDYMTLHAKSKPTRCNQKVRESDESVRANFHQYECMEKFLDVIVADSSRPLWRDQLRLDAIITDPPYGIRESTERIGSSKSVVDKIADHHLPNHIPSRVEYSLSDIVKDLLGLAAQYLKISGRLVFWMPVYRSDYHEDRLPKHPCLSLLCNSEQVLSSHTSRRLLTMVKICEPSDLEIPSADSVVDKTADEFRERFFLHAKLQKRK